MDSIMNYPLYFGMMDAFKLPGPSNISSLVNVMQSIGTTLPVRRSLSTPLRFRSRSLIISRAF